MPRIEIVGVYAVCAEQPVHLVEIWIKEARGILDVGKITQETPDQPHSNWQVPYLERILNDRGDEVITDEFEADKPPDLWKGDVRMAFFFHNLDLGRPLRTPFGEVALPMESPLPSRLAIIDYDPP
jgi:hypothetical protein